VSDPSNRLEAAAERIWREAGWSTPANHAYDVAKNAQLLLKFGAAAKVLHPRLRSYLLSMLTPEERADSAYPALDALVKAVSSLNRKKVRLVLSGPPGALWLFKQIAGRVAQEVTLNPPAIRKPPVPGPSAPGKWVEAGHTYPIPPLQWRLAKCLYKKKSVPEDDVITFVYPGEDEAEGKLRKLQSDTNSTFRTHKIPCKITRPMSGHLSLEKKRPDTSGGNREVTPPSVTSPVKATNRTGWPSHARFPCLI
jgi:hypothetical protein